MNSSNQAQVTYMHRMLSHAYWANSEILKTLQKADPISEKLTSLFGHLLSAEKVWLERLNLRDSTNLSIWPITRLENCEALVHENHDGYQQFLKALNDSDLDTIVPYRNSKGIEFQTSIIDILTHVSLHGSYHRGQISSYLRLEGHEPVNTDFITFVRT